MSTLTLSDLDYISRETLASHMRTAPPSPPSPRPSLAIIDVRDADHVGGHIRGSTWVPSHELDYRTAELVRRLRDTRVVVFHCALSQQRGPSAALRYLREKARLDPGRRSRGAVEGKRGGGGGEEDGDEEVDGDGEGGEGSPVQQKVYVLRGGFTQWQEKYGADEALTEAWQKDLWEFGY